jgi:hypothetical protein
MNVSFRSAFALLLLLFAVVTQAQTTIEPGQTIEFSGADDCVTNEDAGFVSAVTEARCDAAAATLGAAVEISETTEVGGTSADGALWVDFEVGANTDTEGNTVPGWVSYAVIWRGLIEQLDAESQAGVAIVYSLTNLDSGLTLKSERLLDRESPDVGPDEQDDGAADTVAVVLTRGEQYRFLLALECEAAVTGDSLGSVCDYFTESEGYGVSLAALQVKLGLDDTELLGRFDEINERLDDIDEEIEDLEDELDTVKDDLQNIEEDVDRLNDHDHDYLTGRGKGHNNTDATTSRPNLDELPPPVVPKNQPTSDARDPVDDPDPEAQQASTQAVGSSGGGGSLGLITLAFLAGMAWGQKS